MNRAAALDVSDNAAVGEGPDIAAAVAAGDAQAVARALRDDPSVAHRRGADGVRPVLLAAYHHQPELVALIRPHSEPLDVFEAAALGDTARLTELLSADTTVVDAHAPDGFFPLGLAAFFGHLEAVALLLDHGASVETAARNPSGVWAVHAAVAARRADIVARLLQAGADPDATQQGGIASLHAAAQHGDVDIVRLLLDHGATADLADDQGRTPHDLAVTAGQGEAASVLLRP